MEKFLLHELTTSIILTLVFVIGLLKTDVLDTQSFLNVKYVKQASKQICLSPAVLILMKFYLISKYRWGLNKNILNIKRFLR